MSERLHKSQNYLVVEVEGRPHAVFALTDLDGTANDETLEEGKRMKTTLPAKEALYLLSKSNIPSGIITSRSFGEAEEYQRVLEATGPIICEDGAALVLPDGNVLSSNAIQKLGLEYKLIKHEGKMVLVLSKLDKDKFKDFIREVEATLKMRDPKSPPLVSTFSPTEEILRNVGHLSLDFARRSTDRIASAYIATNTTIQRDVISELAPRWGIRTFGEVINLIGEDANKGKALETLNNIAHVFYPGTVGIIPIVFGNNRNDLKLFEQADRMGGIGVIVGHPGGGYFIEEGEIPSYVIKAKQPYGLGMKQVVPQVLDMLRSRYKLE